MSNSAGHRVRDVSVDQAAAQITAGTLVIDVREDTEWAAGHIPTARHIPLADLDPTALAAEGPVLVICRSGNRSSRAATRLAAAGLAVGNVIGGMSAWAAADRAMTSDTGQPPTVI